MQELLMVSSAEKEAKIVAAEKRIEKNLAKDKIKKPEPEKKEDDESEDDD